MDALMSGTSGIEVARQMQQISPSTKVIVVSLYDPEAVAELAKIIGADAFLAKPGIGAHPKTTITDLLKSRGKF